MDPQNQSPQNPAPTNPVSPEPVGSVSAQPQPVAPVPTAQQTPVPVAGQATTDTMSVPLADQTKKSKKGLIAIIAGALALLVVLAIAWIFFLSPAAQAMRYSNKFMHSITTGDIDKATEISGDSTAKSFLTNAAPKVKGSYKLTKVHYDDGKSYFLYDLTGAQNKYARTIVEKQDGKFVIDSFVFDTKPLAIVPTTAATTETPASSDDTSTPAPAPSVSTAACLEQSDYRYMEYDKSQPSVTYDSTYDPAAYTSNYTADMFFKPDSTTEDSLLSVYDDWADFAKHTADKQWKFRLEGSTYGSDAGTAASKQLAQARTDKVKSQLISRGVPANRIVVESPHNYGSEVQDEKSSQIYRRVQLVIDPTCTTSTNNR